MATKQGGSEHLFVRHVLIVLGLGGGLLPRLAAADPAADAVRGDRDRDDLPRRRGHDLQVTRLPNGVFPTGLSNPARARPLRVVALFGAHVAQQVRPARDAAGGMEDAEQRIGDIGLSEQLDRLVATTKPGGGSLSARPDPALDRKRARRTCWS